MPLDLVESHSAFTSYWIHPQLHFSLIIPLVEAGEMLYGMWHWFVLPLIQHDGGYAKQDLLARVEK